MDQSFCSFWFHFFEALHFTKTMFSLKLGKMTEMRDTVSY